MQKGILLFGFLILQISAFCQAYNISIDDRNAAIDLTNQALKKISENKLDDAFSFLTEAIMIDSVFRPPYLQIYKIGLLNKEYYPKVIIYLQKGKRVFVEDDELSFYLGEIYRLNSDLTNAMIEYSAAISYCKINGEDFHLAHNYYFNRGNCFLKQNQLDSAIVDYSSSLKLQPDYYQALVNRGICFYKKGNSTDACADWEKSTELGCTSANDYIEKYCKNGK